MGADVSRRHLRSREKGGAAVGLTRKGKGTKVMLVTDGQGVPLGLKVASAQRAEIKLAELTLDTVRVPRPGGRGRPKCRPQMLVADRGYDSWAFRENLRAWGIRPCIPERRGKKPRPGPKTDLRPYRDRWHIERTFAWFGNFRRFWCGTNTTPTCLRPSCCSSAS